MKNGIKRTTEEGFQVPNPVEDGKRWDWLIEVIELNGFRLGAEVGCARGNTTKRLLKRFKDLRLIAVDLWSREGGVQYRKWNFNAVKNKFDKEISQYKDRVRVIIDLSWNAAKKVENGSLDFVFIDADHEYESVVKDIKAWAPKLKPGGMISGHDTHFPGVIKAVEELIPNYNRAGVDHCWFAKKEDVLI